MSPLGGRADRTAALLELLLPFLALCAEGVEVNLLYSNVQVM